MGKEIDTGEGRGPRVRRQMPGSPGPSPISSRKTAGEQTTHDPNQSEYAFVNFQFTTIAFVQ